MSAYRRWLIFPRRPGANLSGPGLRTPQSVCTARFSHPKKVFDPVMVWSSGAPSGRGRMLSWHSSGASGCGDGLNRWLGAGQILVAEKSGREASDSIDGLAASQPGPNEGVTGSHLMRTSKGGPR